MSDGTAAPPAASNALNEFAVSPEQRAINVGNQANSVTGVYGISGSGKSSLADTAVEYAYETYGALSLGYVADLGGFGTKRLALIRAGILRVYDPRNRLNPFETMELISLGAFPVELIDPERGYAAPDVPLVLPRRLVFVQYCVQGHEAARFEDERVMQAMTTVCPTCGTATTMANCQKVDRVIVRHRLFAGIGFRFYDSITALNDWGMSDLQSQSAKGTLPTGGQGGALLGAADALRSGRFVFGSSSKSQYGFLQNRTYNWLANIRTIPDQVLPPVATFLTETSKGDDESGGEMVIGPKIAGNARTAAVPGWLGNCLHATKEPFSVDDQTMVHRLWLTNHIDPRVPSRIPYLAKHRGTPLGMPEYLEDKPGAAPWSGCSLKVFFSMLQEQLAKEDAATKARYPNAPGMWRGDAAAGPAADDVVSAVAGSSGAAVAAVAQTGPRPVAATSGRRRVAGAGAPVAVPSQTPATSSTPAPVIESAGAGDASVAPAAAVSTPEPVVAEPVHVQQLQASLVERSQIPSEHFAGAEDRAAAARNAQTAAAPAAAQESATTSVVPAPPSQSPPVVAATPGAPTVTRRRVARPPVQ